MISTVTARHARRVAGIALVLVVVGVSIVLAHIVPPERLHPLVESYRRLVFQLALNPVPWNDVAADTDAIGRGLRAADTRAGGVYTTRANALIDAMTAEGDDAPDTAQRKAATRELFEMSTRAMSRLFVSELEAARSAIASHGEAQQRLEGARDLFKAFEHEIRHGDPDAFKNMGGAWLELNMALGHPGLLGVGKADPDPEAFGRNAATLIAYVEKNFAGEKIVSPRYRFAPLPAHSPTWAGSASVPPKLPPGAEINKQLPRPRQVLNMATRGVDEGETVLIAMGDMAFDSHAIFGEPARSLGLTCNTCHNKGVTNPKFFIPGLSTRPGGLDVSNSFFAPHANNGHFDPLDIPDLRGIRFTAPYGRNGRFDSLREFTRNVIVNEFNGPEPEPLMLDAMVAYMLEFDFLPNPYLRPDGRLSDEAGDAARRGEQLFNRSFAQLGDRSCASCHIPSDNFLDRKRHDIGTVTGAEAHSRDGSLDTPTLLSSRYTAPYFHDGSAPTLRAVVEWFDRTYSLALTTGETDDLTAYLETVGYGTDAYEDTMHTLEAELEEFSFFLSTFEFLESRNKPDLMRITFETVAYEVRAHKWDVQDSAKLPVLDRLAELMDAAADAIRKGNRSAARTAVEDYRALYESHKDELL